MIEYLSVEEVIAMHDAFLLKFGGLPGIRDSHLLMSAIETPKGKMFGRDLHPTIYDKAAAYLYHIVCNHPFNDGNKRTGFGSALLFLKANSVTAPHKRSSSSTISPKTYKLLATCSCMPSSSLLPHS